MSVSGLSSQHVLDARHLTVAAAVLGLKHAPDLHYTQDARRWEGIAHNFHAQKGEYPHHADCSSFATWCLWNALHVHFGAHDHVNDTIWKSGYTGTLLGHGNKVGSPLHWGDLIFYGRGFPGEHVAIYVGGGYVISFGSEPGPFKLPMHYRSDFMQARRYI